MVANHCNSGVARSTPIDTASKNHFNPIPGRSSVASLNNYGIKNQLQIVVANHFNSGVVRSTPHPEIISTRFPAAPALPSSIIDNDVHFLGGCETKQWLVMATWRHCSGQRETGSQYKILIINQSIKALHVSAIVGHAGGFRPFISGNVSLAFLPPSFSFFYLFIYMCAWFVSQWRTRHCLSAVDNCGTVYFPRFTARVLWPTLLPTHNSLLIIKLSSTHTHTLRERERERKKANWQKQQKIIIERIIIITRGKKKEREGNDKTDNSEQWRE